MCRRGGGGGGTPFCSLLLCLGSAIWGDVLWRGGGGGQGSAICGVCYLGRCVGGGKKRHFVAFCSV